jgi:hypothetical protein
MSGLRKKEQVDFRQRSTDQLFPCSLRDWLLNSDLPTMRLKFPRGGIRDFKKQNYSSA